MASVTESIETAQGIHLAYERAGRGEPPLVFIHGWCCDRSYFSPQIEFFAPRHATLSLDLRGHGKSARPAPEPGVYGIEALASDVLAAAKGTGFVRPVLVGHSLGGVVALAAAKPESVRAAVLINPALMLDESSRTFAQGAIAAIQNDTDGAWRTAFAEQIMLPTDRAYRSHIRSTVAAVPAPIAAAAWKAIATTDGKALLEGIRVPLLVIHSGDRGVRHLMAYRTITLGVTVGAGHFNHLEVPHQVNSMIERFLSQID